MILSSEQLKKLLVAPGHISEADFNLAVKEANEKGQDIESLFVEKELIRDDQLGQLIAGEIKFPYVNLKKEKIPDNVLNLIPELVARSKNVIAFARDKEGVKVGMSDPYDLEIIHFIQKRVGEDVLPYYATRKDIKEALAKYQGNIRIEFELIFKKLRSVSLTREKRDELTVQLVDKLLEYGYQNKASDVHIEPYQDRTIVRFRIDGIMHDVLEIPKYLSDFILLRIKILSRMRTDEHMAAQDGKLRFKIEKETVDVRISIVPVTEGENVVMRLLSAKSRQFSLIDLGLSDIDFKKLRLAINNPHGMILVTGPTGSGKTTTVYAVLKILNTREVHISTIEDPVEYNIEGPSQIQVNPKTNLTFASGLRAIVRQDPNIIMIGEIRDQETADIAVNSAMTGHLVLSTLHANDTATTLPRLMDMGIEPFLIASTVNIIIAQRLVRKNCAKCLMSYMLTDEEQVIVQSQLQLQEVLEARGYKDFKRLRLYKGAGCQVCNNTGYTDRIGIFEVMEINAAIRELIIKRASSDIITKVARENGMTTMLEDGVNKMLNGTTTLYEVLRVTKG